MRNHGSRRDRKNTANREREHPPHINPIKICQRGCQQVREKQLPRTHNKIHARHSTFNSQHSTFNRTTRRQLSETERRQLKHLRKEVAAPRVLVLVLVRIIGAVMGFEANGMKQAQLRTPKLKPLRLTMLAVLFAVLAASHCARALSEWAHPNSAWNSAVTRRKQEPKQEQQSQISPFQFPQPGQDQDQKHDQRTQLQLYSRSAAVDSGLLENVLVGSSTQQAGGRNDISKADDCDGGGLDGGAVDSRFLDACMRRRIDMSAGSSGNDSLDGSADEVTVSIDGVSRRRMQGIGTSCCNNDDVQLVSRVKMWPPWPFSLLSDVNDKSNEKANASDATDTRPSSVYPSTAALFWAYFQQRARIGLRQCQQVGSQLWYHMPPAAPPFMLLATIPSRVVTGASEAGGEALAKRIIPLVSDPFARNVALAGLGMAITSWAHMEVHRKRILAPLPGLPSRGVWQVFLPPPLPEDVPEPEIEALESIEQSQHDSGINGINASANDRRNGSSDGDTDSSGSNGYPKLRKPLSMLYEKSPNARTLHNTIAQMRRVRSARKREIAKIHRLSVFDELVALQALKRRSAHQANNARKRLSNQQQKQQQQQQQQSEYLQEEKPNYALVTGASQGIGRAIAVELARWEVPLILVARDVDRLTSLAYDLEACYGVRCCVLEADLSDPNSAEKIHQATTGAGLCVDILVNNAGIGGEGDAVDMPVDEINRMVTVNTLTYSKLAQLYGKDMKEQRRGRILMLSSMAGLASASPKCALYGATKAFGLSLSRSLGNEMEPYGVGVTCLVPGPVSTQFRARSNTQRALCWHIPFYVKSAQTVAHHGVMALLGGESQVIPGWQNRVFSKLFRPVLPQRMEIMTVKTVWTPFELPVPTFLRRRKKRGMAGVDSDVEISVAPKPNLQPRYNFQRPPRMLTLPEPEVQVAMTVDAEVSGEANGDDIEEAQTNAALSGTPPSMSLHAEQANAQVPETEPEKEYRNSPEADQTTGTFAATVPPQQGQNQREQQPQNTQQDYDWQRPTHQQQQPQQQPQQAQPQERHHQQYQHQHQRQRPTQQQQAHERQRHQSQERKETGRQRWPKPLRSNSAPPNEDGDDGTSDSNDRRSSHDRQAPWGPTIDDVDEFDLRRSRVQ